MRPRHLLFSILHPRPPPHFLQFIQRGEGMEKNKEAITTILNSVVAAQ